MPDRTYPMQIGYWGIPNLTSDSLPEAIPLMPAFLHHVLLKKLEAQIFRYTLGEGAQKYQAALSEYGTLVAKYQGSMGMTPGEQADYSADDDVGWTTGHAAVQSTH